MQFCSQYIAGHKSKFYDMCTSDATRIVAPAIGETPDAVVTANAQMSRKALPAFKASGRVAHATALTGDHSPEAFLGNHLVSTS